MNWKKGIVSFVAIGLVALLGYVLLFGKLTPFSPLVIGLKRHELPRVVIYAEKGCEFTHFDEIDSLIPAVEQFHSLRFKHKPRIFLFGNAATFQRRVLSKARFCTYYHGDIMVSPWAQKEAVEGAISMDIYMRHELSHSLLYQNAGILRAVTYPAWLLEGIAMYSANQLGTSWYPSTAETCEYMRQGNFIHPREFKTRSESRVSLQVSNRMAFIYSEFGCLVDFLVTEYGRDKFQQYMIRLLRESDHDALFEEIFYIDFETFILQFKKMASAGL